MSRSVLCLAAILLLAPEAPAADAKLTPEDAKYLDKLLADCLFDPTGAERVRGEFPAYSPWGGSGAVAREGWLVRGKKGEPNRVYITDGLSLPAPDALSGLNFVDECKELYAKEKPKKGNGRDEVFERMERTARGVLGESDLALAAWLHKLGHDDLAAKALAAARRQAADFARGRRDAPPDPRDVLREELAWEAFAGLVHGYVNRADEFALVHGNQFFRRYPDYFVRDRSYRQAEQIVGELNRRKKEGQFGKGAAPLAPNELPADAGKKVAALVAALDEVDARQWGQPGGVNLGEDWRVKALIEVGEPAVPALIDALETDARLTRSVHFWRDFSHSRTVLSVREAQLVALMSILRVQVFEPASTGDNFTARGEEAANQTAARLRAYWDTYGKFPFDERMMKILTDPKSGAAACREAAENLATLGSQRTIGTTVWSGGWLFGPDDKPNPAVAKFSNPTAAEAILAAMDRDLKAITEGKEKPDEKDRLSTATEGGYLDSLIQLGDKRIGPTVAKRAAAAKTLDSRRKFALAALRLGEAKPLEELARAFEAGSLPLEGLNDPPDRNGRRAVPSDLSGLVWTLVAADVPAADRALFALADPKHPYHRATREALLERQSFDGEFWSAHPYFLRVLRRALDDVTPTGAVYLIEENALKRKVADGWSSQGIPDDLLDPKLRKETARERVCDQAAERIAKLVPGLAVFHPLRTDGDAAIKAMKETLDRFDGRFRRLSYAVGRALDLSPFDPAYAPEVKPLEKGATADDMSAGRALFHLNGKGQPAGVKLPAVVMLRKDANGVAVRGLALQAETGPDGIVYGVIFKHGVRAVPAGEVDKVELIGK